MRIELLVEGPRGIDQPAEMPDVLAAHGFGHPRGQPGQLAQGRHGLPVAVQVAADNILQDVLCQPRHAGVVEQGLSAVEPRIEYVGGHVADRRFGHHARLGRDKLQTADRTADLVLPAATGGQFLLQPQDIVKQPILGKRAAHHAIDDGQQHGSHDA